MYQLKKALGIYIEENIIKYILLLSVLFAGILGGVILSGNISTEMSGFLKGEIEPLIEGLSPESINQTQIFYSSFLKNSRIFIFVFLCGLFIWLLPLVFLNMLFVGFSLGFASGYLCTIFGGMGMWIAITSLLPSVFISIPLYIFVSVLAINNSLYRKNGYLNKGRFKKYVLLFLFVYLISNLSVVVDSFLIPALVMMGCS